MCRGGALWGPWTCWHTVSPFHYTCGRQIRQLKEALEELFTKYGRRIPLSVLRKTHHSNVAALSNLRILHFVCHCAHLGLQLSNLCGTCGCGVHL